MRLLCFSFTENGVAIKLSSRPCNTADEMVGAPGRSIHERPQRHTSSFSELPSEPLNQRPINLDLPPVDSKMNYIVHQTGTNAE
jgi:hypothetical protein